MEIPIEGYNNMYTLDREGNVYSKKFGKSITLKPQKASQSKKGYGQVRLFNKEYPNGRLHYVHRLVWETFNGKIPDGLEIDHIDTDTSNNSLDNLQLLTRRENIQKYNKKAYGSIVRDRRDEFIELYKKLGTYKKVEEETGVSYQCIYRSIKDVIHRYDFKNKKFITVRYNEDLNDKYTDVDLRGSVKRKRDEKGRFIK